MRRDAPALAWGIATMLVASSGCITPGPKWSEAPALQSDSDQYIEVEGAWLRVRDTPAHTERGLPTVIFVHGYGSRLEAWRELQPRLARSRRVVSFDQRGFGQSSRAKADYGPKRHADDVLALMDALDIESAILVGHSYGGGVVLRAALDAPERVLGIGLVSAFALEAHMPTDFRWAKIPVVGELLFGAFYKEVPGEKYLLAFEDRDRFVSLEALDEIEAIMDQPGATYTALATVRGMEYAEAERAYRDITVPVVVVWGEDDKVVPLDGGKKLAAAVDAPLVVLPACGHMPSWERPRSLLKALAPMMEEAASAHPAPERARLAPAVDTDVDDSALDDPQDGTSTPRIRARPAQRSGRPDQTPRGTPRVRDSGATTDRETNTRDERRTAEPRDEDADDAFTEDDAADRDDDGDADSDEADSDDTPLPAGDETGSSDQANEMESRRDDGNDDEADR